MKNYFLLCNSGYYNLYIDNIVRWYCDRVKTSSTPNLLDALYNISSDEDLKNAFLKRTKKVVIANLLRSKEYRNIILKIIGGVENIPKRYLDEIFLSDIGFWSKKKIPFSLFSKSLLSFFAQRNPEIFLYYSFPLDKINDDGIISLYITNPEIFNSRLDILEIVGKKALRYIIKCCPDVIYNFDITFLENCSLTAKEVLLLFNSEEVYEHILIDKLSDEVKIYLKEQLLFEVMANNSKHTRHTKEALAFLDGIEDNVDNQ